MTREDAIRVLILCDKKPNCKYTEGMIKTAQEVAAAIAIGQKPSAKLDRNLWEGCDWCNQRYCDNCFWQIKMKDSSRCEHCSNKSEWEPIVSYCSNCGRPLTEEAWTELESRIGRNDRKETSYA